MLPRMLPAAALTPTAAFGGGGTDASCHVVTFGDARRRAFNRRTHRAAAAADPRLEVPESGESSSAAKPRYTAARSNESHHGKYPVVLALVGDIVVVAAP